MKTDRLLKPTLTLSFLGLIPFYCVPTQAQITPDSSLPNPSIVTRDGNDFRLDGGTELGNNLFHSFQEFSVPTNTEAFFNNANSIANIFSRVTGSLPSNIDGILRANGTANLFLINPNGILFGPNAQLNLNGSFLASTADRFEFSGGLFWSATNPNAPPLLTVNVPIGLQFSPEAGSIAVRGSMLEVPAGQSLALIGGNLSLESAQISAPSGQLTLAAIASGTLQLDPKLAILTNNLPTDFRDIQLTSNTSINNSGNSAGGIQIFGRQVTLDGSKITSMTEGQPGGDVVLNATEAIEAIGTGENIHFVTSVLLGNSLNPGHFSNGIFIGSQASGNSGNLTITAPQLSLDNGAIIASIARGSGRSGDINITSDRIETNSNDMTFSMEQNKEFLPLDFDVNFTPPQILNAIITITFQEGNAGNLNLNTRQLAFNNTTLVSSITFGAGRSGNVTVEAETIDLAQKGLIGTLSFGLGNGGNTHITADRIFVDRQSILFSVTTASGNAGDLTIDTRQFTATQGATITTATLANPGNPSGRGGNLTLNASEFVDLRRIGVERETGGNIQAGTSGDGDGGKILINTQRLITGGQRSSIDTATEGGGRGGDITINATESVELTGGGLSEFPLTGMAIQQLLESGAVRAKFSSLTTGSFNSNGEGNTGDAGNLTLNTGRLILRNGAGILTGTADRGRGGNLTVNASESIEIDNRSALATATLGSQRAGDVSVTTPQLTLTNGAVILADTFGEGGAGNLQIQTDQLSLLGGGQIRAGTSGSGRGGTLLLRAEDTLNLMGTSPSGVPSNLSTSSTSSGNAGDLVVISPHLTIQEGATLTVSSANTGAAGNLQVNVGQLRMDGGTISANTDAGDLGNIQINASNIQLRQSSRITTNTNTSTGGNITINTDTLAALENSDITANAAAGRGGRVTANAQGVLGTEFRPFLTPESDITATSDLGPDFNGVVEINTPDLDRTRGALSAPEIQTSELVAQTPCTIADRDSQFIVTGRGGLPPSPATPATSEPTWQDWEAIEVAESESVPSPPANQSRSHNPETPLEQALAPEFPQLVEAQGWYINSDGKVILTAEASGTAPHLQPEFAPSCQSSLSGG
jgi:filamentous hemagglutinin family protein